VKGGLISRRTSALSIPEAGVSLVEVIAATLIAAIAIAGLAHSFGVGRAQIERFAVARAGLAVAEQRMEALSLCDMSHPHMALGQHDTTFVVDGQVFGDTRWWVTSEPKTWTTHSDQLIRVNLEVTWNQGYADTIRLTRLFDR
jgi:type II secretory pathway pseudopilin PulG